MCSPPNYCSYCLTRMQRVALRKNDVERASQLTTMIAEKEALLTKPKAPKGKVKTSINLKDIKGKIAVDLDDTVGSFEADMRQALAERDGLTYEEALARYPSNPPNGIASWWEDEDDPSGYSYKEFEDLEKRGLLYRDQPVRAGAGETINWLHKNSDGKVVFLTARPEAFNGVSEEWLKKKVGIDFPISISNSTKKEEEEGYEVLIDDSVPHVKAVTSVEAPHGPRKVVFMTRPRTHANVEASEYAHHAWSWSDVKKIFQAGEEEV